MRFGIAVSLISVLSLSGCGGSAIGGSTTSPGSSGGTTNVSMSAKIDGTQWTATTLTATRGPVLAGLPNGTVAVSGTGSFANQNIIITFAMPANVGTSMLGPAGGIANPQSASLQNTTAGMQWNATSLNGSGSLTLNSVTLTSATGNFSFILTPVSTTTATGTRIVTEGTFIVTF